MEHVVDGLGTAIAVGNAILDDLAQMHAGHHLRGLEVVDLRITLVGDNQAKLCIEHGQALGHVVQGRIELNVLRAQLSHLAVEGAGSAASIVH